MTRWIGRFFVINLETEEWQGGLLEFFKDYTKDAPLKWWFREVDPMDCAMKWALCKGVYQVPYYIVRF